MKAISGAQIVCIIIVASLMPCTVWAEAIPNGAQCGTNLWQKKILADRAVSEIGKTPVDTTVGHLVSLSPPADPEQVTGRLAPMETTIWRVRAQLVGYRLEKDSDYHLILRDPSSAAEMVAEIPAPFCVSRFGDRYAQLRTFVDKLGDHVASKHFWWLDYHGAIPPTVTVTGVGFFDREHAQAAVAPNGAELHPVLDIQR